MGLRVIPGNRRRRDAPGPNDPRCTHNVAMIVWSCRASSAPRRRPAPNRRGRGHISQARPRGLEIDRCMNTRLKRALLALGFGAAAAVVAANAASLSPTGPSAANVTFRTVSVVAEPVSLHFEHQNVERVDGLTYLGGIEIKSDDPRFGGLSGLRVSPDGQTMLAVSDHGSWVGATLQYSQGRLTGVSDLVIAPILNSEGRTLPELDKVHADAEALTEIPGSGLVVAFEGDHRLWHYGASLTDAFHDKRPLPLPLPVDMVQTIAQLPSNMGIEGLTTLLNGDILAIAEGGLDKENETLKAWLVGRSGIRMLAYHARDNFKPTDLATLPNGDILVLERRFTLLQGLATRLRRVRAASLHDDAPLEGEIVATLAFPYNIDNMEGLAVRRNEAGETLVYMVSDDNFNPLQRTLLMMFRLEDAPRTPEPQPMPEPTPGVILAAGQ
ncbi:MAG: hypothetical protein D6763_05935 [Alphaproteobacteria bacterium]|nr:MAG: hypothetical protein D6763_05935 [Alphaproteobacteria bacterium]